MPKRTRTIGALQRMQDGGTPDPSADETDPNYDGMSDGTQDEGDVYTSGGGGLPDDLMMPDDKALGMGKSKSPYAGIDPAQQNAADLAPFKMMQQRQDYALQALKDAQKRATDALRPSGDNRAMWLSIASGLLAPTRTGSFGESLGYGAGNAAPYMEKNAEANTAYKQALTNMDYGMAQNIYQQSIRPPQLIDWYARNPQGTVGKQKAMIVNGTPVPFGEVFTPQGAGGNLQAKFDFYSQMLNDPDPKKRALAQQMLQKPATNITVNGAAEENSADKAIGTGEGNEYVKIQNAGKDANVNMAKMERLGQLLQDAGTGKYRGDINEFQKALKTFGVNPETYGVTDKTAVVDAAKPMINELALAARSTSSGGGMPGSLSDSDRRFLTEMVPSLETSPAAIPMLVDYYKRLSQRDIDIARIAREYKKGNGGKYDDGVYDAMQKFADSHPLFTNADIAAIKAAAKGGGGGAAGNNTLQHTHVSVDENGDITSTPNGQ